MRSISQDFVVPFSYQTYFTEGLFKPNNLLFRKAFEDDGHRKSRKMLFIIDEGVTAHHPELQKEILEYMHLHKDAFELKTSPIIVPGGEQAKNDPELVNYILKEIDEFGICRHSYVVAIGGGAVLDMVGYAAAVAHRGVRLVRIPTTVLSQNDSGVGVKNGVNAFNKKNFLGTFKPPFAVINDSDFLKTLEMRDWRGGISEAIKVALIKDKVFFEEIEQNHQELSERDQTAMDSLIFRCAELHVDHISGGDPFEMGSSRPLDFGHWAAHKLEQLTQYQLRHGEAVAIGIALDVTYSYLKEMISREDWERIIQLFENLGFDLYHPELSAQPIDHPRSILRGLSEFREHLGGELTIMLLDEIGHGVEVHEMDHELVQQAVLMLKERQSERVVTLG